MSRTSTKSRFNNDHASKAIPLSLENMDIEVQAKGPARVSFVGYNGNPVMLTDYGLDYPAVYDIATMITNNKNPVLYRHKEEVGHTTEIKKPENKQVIGKAVLSIPNERTKEITGGIENGFSYQGSIGVDATTKNFQLIPAGKTLIANGREYAGPVYFIKNTRLREMTITVFGRDEETHFELLNEEERMRLKNEAIRLNNEKPDDVTPPVVPPVTPPAPAPTVPPVVPPVDPIKINNEARDDEALRIENENLKKELDLLKGKGEGKAIVLFNQLSREFPENIDLIEKGFDEGKSAEDIRNSIKVHRYENNMPALPNTQRPKTKDDEFTSEIKLRMCLSLNMKPEFLESKFGKEAVEKAAAKPMLSPGEMVVRVANQIGGGFDPYSDIDDVCKHIKSHQMAMDQTEALRLNNSPGFSTVSLSNILESVSQIQLEERWKLDPPFAPRVLKEASNKDFRPTQKMRVQGGEVWDKVQKDGTLKHTTFGTENFYTTKLDTVGKMLVLDRPTIINDDMDVISDMMDAMVEGAYMVPDMKLGNLLFEAAGAGQFFVNADNSNTSTALTRTNLSARYKKLMTYNEVRGGLTWKNMVNDKWWLVIDPTMEETAWEIIKQDVIVGNTTANTIQGQKNFWFNKFEIIMFPQMSNTSLFGSGTFVSAGTWFLWPKSVKFSPYVITYLRGRKSPTIERVSLPENILGSGVRGYWDVEVDERERLLIDRNNG